MSAETTLRSIRDMITESKRQEAETGQAQWSIAELSRSHYKSDLPQCTTQLERDCAFALNRKQMRELRDEKLATGKKMTPLELATLAQWGLLPD